ncbi:MAG TPA: DMT family transporter [Candidatus Limnocylindria bacterium]|nr:DMT family transporter [Candidatus Limnocylindria bacterium]
MSHRARQGEASAPWFDALAERPLATAVVGALIIAVSAILVRLADVPPATAAFFRCFYALPPLALLALWEQRRYGARDPGQRRLAWIAGFFFAVDLVVWHHAINAVGAGLATVLGNTQVVIVPLIAWLVLRERPSPRVAAAVPVVLFGVLLISGVLEAEAFGANPALGVLLGVATGFAYAGFLLVLRRGNADQRRPAGPLFDATLSATVFCALIGLPLGELELVPALPAHAWLLLLALGVQVAGWLVISISLPRLPAALTSVVLTIQPVGSVLLAMWLLREAPSALQLVGTLCILAGLAIATLRRRDPARLAEPEIG